MEHIIDLAGGEQTMLERLETIFSENIFDSTNEP
jgi:hypothetical protein